MELKVWFAKSNLQEQPSLHHYVITGLQTQILNLREGQTPTPTRLTDKLEIEKWTRRYYRYFFLKVEID
jgi:hypothetical protein